MMITGKAILVTGASRGIGEALVAEALSRGATPDGDLAQVDLGQQPQPVLGAGPVAVLASSQAQDVAAGSICARGLPALDVPVSLIHGGADVRPNPALARHGLGGTGPRHCDEYGSANSGLLPVRTSYATVKA
jgi:NAD(P)-dependent dehydrogenase (short-subunit alcohol dehydrogenase family)